MIAKVIVDVLNKQVNRSFDYLVPQHLEEIISIGYRVYVPFGTSKRVGFVIDISNETLYKKKLKPIIELIDIYPVLNAEFVNLAKYIADNNFSFYATALQQMVPAALKIKYKKYAKVVNYEGLSIQAKEIFKKREILIEGFDNDKQKILYSEVKNKNVVLLTKIKKRKDENEIDIVSLNEQLLDRYSKKENELISYLKEIGGRVELEVLINDMGYSKPFIRSLETKKIISIFKEKKFQPVDEKISTSNSKIVLNDEQQKAFSSVVYDKFNTYLLHGVTGSGKTEVYMCWIEQVLKTNKTAILLVPEISLTPQITSILKQRFLDDIAIFHSRLTMVEKFNEWNKVYNNQTKIVVGARSAIFAPLKNLGIIIVDECHESSYIQQNNPKYSAIEIAKLRCQYNNCPLILGSATPNVCDYYYATNGEYELLTIAHRANGRKLPESIVVDMTSEFKNQNRSVFSKLLQKELISCYQRKEQSILFLNRRGYSSFVMCRNCGETIKCPHCDISLTYHHHSQTLKCHYCGYTTKNVLRCSNCGSDKIRYVGSGTEKIVDEVNKLLPEAKVLRLDLDTTTNSNFYEEAFNIFKNHQADILVGTQMITKGLDFSDVTLVGVVNADLALSYPTYDATMTCYNLIEQVSGRAGRREKDGKVIIQTYNPHHYVIECVKRHDYEAFYNYEIKKRKMMLLPPYSTIIEIIVSSLDANKAYNEATTIANNLRSVAKSSIVLGPTEALIFKKRDYYRFQIQIQAVEDSVLDKIRYIYPLYQNNKDVDLSITRL